MDLGKSARNAVREMKRFTKEGDDSVIKRRISIGVGTVGTRSEAVIIEGKVPPQPAEDTAGQEILPVQAPPQTSET